MLLLEKLWIQQSFKQSIDRMEPGQRTAENIQRRSLAGFLVDRDDGTTLAHTLYVDNEGRLILT